MRPVRLEMDGFASFRSATTVDFTEADYFALVGATGSGKSTVLDAIVFALYGTAPRWGRSNAIEYALAPTSTRGTVRLVFDVGSLRYQIAREVRRVGSAGQVMQKGAFLERFLDSTATSATSEEVQTVAAELREVRGAVEQLIGLTLDDFTQAVVLPQGRFAEFLHAKPSERHDILLKLLGADQYEQIRKRAAERQRDGELQAEQVGALLAEVADATPQLRDEAEARVAELVGLSEDVDARLGALTGLREASVEAGRARQGLTESVGRLSGLSAPEGVADLTQRADALATALAAARAEEGTASDALNAAREALEAAGSRTELEHLASQWLEASSLTVRLPDLRAASESAREEMEQAHGVLDEARGAWQVAHQQVERCTQARNEAAAALDEVERRRATLAATVSPTDVPELAGRVARATAALTAAREAAEQAELTEVHARAAAEEAGDGANERRSQDWIRQRSTLRADLSSLDAAVDETRGALSVAQAAVEEAEREVSEAEQRLQSAQDSGSAATLRAHLTVGDDCPVCEQRVEALPAKVSAGPQVEEARAHLASVQAGLRTAQAAHREAEREMTAAALRASAKRETLAEVEGRIAEAHPETPSDDLERHITERLAQVDHAAGGARDAAAHLRATREARVAAQREVDSLADEVRTGRETFRTARAPFLAWGFSSDEPDDLAQAWETLTTWIGAETGRLDDVDLPQSRARRDAAAAALTEATTSAAATNTRFEQAQAAATGAARADATASGEVERAEARSQELAEALRDAMDAAQVLAAVGHLTHAESTEKAARELHRAKLAALRKAAEDQEAAQTEIREARQALHAARDTLVHLGAPSLDEQNLGLAWGTLLGWAGNARTQVQQQLDDAITAADEAVSAVTAAEAALVAAASARGVAVDDPSRVATAVAAALADARTTVTSVVERIQKRARFEKKQATATEEARVAGLLAASLRSDKFQKWLAGAALDMLVAAASDTLHELSGGQYGLTHDKGEFFVIDHEDAEATRSVRTLSGGETFQTSLALALALSDQLSSLSSSSTKLESLFLDEGFGTLDADSLETVALTLERLAQGDRMVGVVTHVPSLAERVPTRFQVTRDSQGSRVVREG